jgi:hypothetical protein
MLWSYANEQALLRDVAGIDVEENPFAYLVCQPNSLTDAQPFVVDGDRPGFLAQSSVPFYDKRINARLTKQICGYQARWPGSYNDNLSLIHL